MRLIPVFLAASLVLALAGTAHAAPKVAVVDIVACMEAHPETQRVDDAWNKAKDTASKNYEEEKKRVSELERLLQQMNAEDPARPQKERQLALQVAAMNFNAEWAEREARIVKVRSLEAVYKAVCGEIRRYALENAIEIVLARTNEDKAQPTSDPNEFMLKTRLRIVLHADAKVDITDAIVQLLKAK